MDVIQMGTQLLMQKVGMPGNADQVSRALKQLLSGKDGRIDMAGLIERMTNGDGTVQKAISSMLSGSGAGGLNAGQILGLFGNEKVMTFAAQLGVNEKVAVDGLSTVLPQLISGSGGVSSLLESAGGLGGLLGSAKKLF
jgi:uncharacterized protein YidB (DUF937 family)